MSAIAAPQRRLPVLLSALVLVLVLVGLGVWQLQRLHWKQDLLDTIAERTAAQPMSFTEFERKLRTGELSWHNLDYIPVTVAGTFNHGAERHFFATWKGQTGFYVYTPLELSGGGRFVFINRGFVPYELKDPARRPQGQVAGPVAVTGLLRDAPVHKPSSMVPDNDVAKNIFYWKDIRAMTALASLKGTVFPHFFIDANDAPNPGGLPQGGMTMIDLPNSHLQYAITWFGLAAALAGVVIVWLRRAG